MSNKTISVLLQDLSAQGIELQIHSNKIRYYPSSAMTDDLANRMKRFKSEIITYLFEGTEKHKSGMSSPFTVSFKSISRNQAAKLIRIARMHKNYILAIDLRDTWHERIAICTITGGLSEIAAEKIALTDIKTMIDI